MHLVARLSKALYLTLNGHSFLASPSQMLRFWVRFSGLQRELPPFLRWKLDERTRDRCLLLSLVWYLGPRSWRWAAERGLPVGHVRWNLTLIPVDHRIWSHLATLLLRLVVAALPKIPNICVWQQQRFIRQLIFFETSRAFVFLSTVNADVGWSVGSCSKFERSMGTSDPLLKSMLRYSSWMSSTCHLMISSPSKASACIDSHLKIVLLLARR